MTDPTIYETVQTILAAVQRIEARLAAAPAGAAPAVSKSAGTAASDRDLDGPKGNPDVRRDPKGWDGPTMVGRQFSECPPEYLDKLASLFDWMAQRDDEAGARGEKDAKGYPKSGKWKHQDAALARGWANRLRLRGGQHPSSDPFADTGEIPF